MASPSFAPKPLSQKRLSLAEIDAIVSAKLGTTRTPGNAQPACFNRQVAMYLAARIGRWSTTEIGRFYNGRDHSTVCHGIQRIQSLRESNPEIDALVLDLKHHLAAEAELNAPAQITRLVPVFSLSESQMGQLADLVAARVYSLIVEK